MTIQALYQESLTWVNPDYNNVMEKSIECNIDVNNRHIKDYEILHNVDTMSGAIQQIIEKAYKATNNGKFINRKLAIMRFDDSNEESVVLDIRLETAKTILDITVTFKTLITLDIAYISVITGVKTVNNVKGVKFYSYKHKK